MLYMTTKLLQVKKSAGRLTMSHQFTRSKWKICLVIVQRRWLEIYDVPYFGKLFCKEGILDKFYQISLQHHEENPLEKLCQMHRMFTIEYSVIGWKYWGNIHWNILENDWFCLV